MPRPSLPLATLQADVINAARAYVQALRGGTEARVPLDRLEQALTGLDAAVPPGEGHFAGLTPTQLEILGRMAHGDSNPEIAETLGIKVGTLKVHTTAIFKALGVVNRIQAVDTYWRQNGEPEGIMGAMTKLPKLRGLVAVA